MCKLIGPGGYLVTLVFPIDPPKLEGPPFMVRPDDYTQVLGPSWEKVLDKVPEFSLPHHKDRERIIVWRKV
jgi:methyl halide transferase